MEPLKARLFYYPTLLWNVARKSDARRWYDRVDENVVLGALPFHSHASDVSPTARLVIRMQKPNLLY